MSSFVDFKELKQRVSIEQVVTMLGLELKRHQHQLRGCCPIHKGDSDREFVVTPEKGLFFCFGGCGGGDHINLVAKLKRVPPKQAATLINDHFGSGVERPAETPAIPVREPRSDSAKRVLQPLPYLEATHELVQAAGLSTETAKTFGAGYAPKGILRGRLAVPVHDREGHLLAYCGRALKGESPLLTFPNGFDPTGIIFNAHRVGEGELYIVRDPLRVLIAFDAGIENVVSFLTEGIAAQQLEILAGLMDEKKSDVVTLF